MITIGIPFYNAEATLVDAVRSVFAQTFQDWELLLVDDGSSDDSLSIAQAVNDPRVRVVSDTHNKGLAYRLNQIAQLAQGQYLARMDADDLMHPRRLQTQLDLLDAQPDVDAVQTGMCIVDKNLNPTGIRFKTSLDTRPAAVLAHGLLFHATLTGNTSWFRANPYNETLMRIQDHELWCRTCQNSTFATLPDPLYFCREVGTVTLGKYLGSLAIQRKVYRMHGPALVGSVRTLELELKSYLKGGIYAGFSAFGKTDYLVRQRSQSLSAQQRHDALAAIQTILQTPVPGLT